MKKKPQPLKPQETAYLLETMWAADMNQKQKLEIGDNTCSMLAHLLGKKELRSASSEWVYLLNKTFEISSHVHPKKALELCMQYLQRYLEHDPEVTQIAVNWLDHVTGYHGLTYPEGSRLLNNVLLRFSVGEDIVSVGCAAYATRILLRWKYDQGKLIDIIKTSPKAVNIFATTLKWQPIVPRYLVNDFLPAALKDIQAADQKTHDAIYPIYHRDPDTSFVDYSVLDQDDNA